MQSHTGLDSVDHLGANCGVVDVCADIDSSEDGHDVERESVTHGIYHPGVSPPNKVRKGYNRHQ